MSATDLPLSWDDTQETFAALTQAGCQVIVVGGQAVNFWVQWCEKNTGATFDGRPFTSKDIDLIGNKRHVEQCARVLGGTPHIPGPDHATPEQGYVEATSPSGKVVRIDFLSDSRPNDAERIKSNSVPFVVDWGEFRVMDPVACMKTRAFNVVKLAHKYNNEHGIRQLNASIKVVTEFCRATLANQQIDNPERLVLSMFKECYEFSKGPLGRALRNSHGIEVFDAVQPLPGLPESFATECYPRWDRIVRGRPLGSSG